MTRAWSLVVAAGAALAVLGAYLFTLVPLVERMVRAARDPGGRLELDDHPALVAARACSFLVARSGWEPLAPALDGLHWLPILVLLVLVSVLTYLAARNAVAGSPHAAAVGAGAALLAAAAGEIAGLIIACLRYQSAPDYAEPGRDFSAGAVVAVVWGKWTSDAVFLGLLLAIAVSVSLVLQRLAWRVTGLAFEPREIAARIRDVPGRAGNLALFGLIPIAALAFLGGADRFVAPEGPGTYSLTNEVAKIVLYPQVRPTAPPDRKVGFEATLAPEQWLPDTILGVVFLGALWLLLRLVVAGLPDGPGVSGFLLIWGTVVLAGALLAFADSAVTALMAGDSPDREFVRGLLKNLPLGVWFGAVWGWLPALIMLVAHRRTAVATTADS
jgi:hypothetical protein